MSLKERIQSDMKDAMRARDTERLGVIRMAMAAIKQREVDSREDLDEPGTLAVLEKMVKQRRESIRQYRDGGRDDLADKEQSEIDVLAGYLPEQLDEAAVEALVDEAIASTGASGMRDMGKVMGILKAKAQGQTDMGILSALVKARLAG